MDDEQIQNLIQCQKFIMGSREDRDPDILPFENNVRAKSVRPNQRCYSLALTVEQPRGTGAPVASGKVRDGGLDEHQKGRKELIRVRIPASVPEMSSLQT